MKKIFTILTGTLFAAGLFAQQDPMFTKYMFNSLVYNPAYAGSKDYMSIVTLHRDQWWGIEGGPKTQTFTIHSPLQDEHVGVGLSFYNDNIGPVNQMNLNVNYAYRIIFNNNSKLSLGLQASVMNWNPDWSELSLKVGADQAFIDEQSNFWLPNFGAGAFYYSDKMYLGLSVPHVLNHILSGRGYDPNDPNAKQIARQMRHYFLMGGLAIPLDGTKEDFVFKPSFIVKNSNLFGEFNLDKIYSNVGAPTEFDLDLSLLFYKTLWVGTAFRSAFEGFNGSSSFDSVDFWAAYYLRNGFRIGVAYDFPLTPLRSAAQGSVEIILGYDFDYKEEKIVTPRYF